MDKALVKVFGVIWTVEDVIIFVFAMIVQGLIAWLFIQWIANPEYAKFYMVVALPVHLFNAWRLKYYGLE